MTNAPKVAFYTLGCKLNFSETSTISRKFEDAGYSKVAFSQFADVYVINTCSVTENADKECRKVVKDALRINPEAFVCVTGCYAQLQPEQVASIEGVDLVAGATEKFKLSQLIGNLQKKSIAEIHSCEIEQANVFEESFSFGDRTRAFLKVQDGCDYPCTYCTIPMARGISRSDTLDNILNNAVLLSEKGIKEIVLTGVNIGDYGKGEFGNKKHLNTFLELITELDKINGIERFRISSIEPNLLSNEIISFVASSQKFVPHFHIPLQSGSNPILAKMKRRYKRELYQSRVEYIKNLMPHACIGVDVIVGFPGETDEYFEETYSFLNQLDISYLHVFTFSARPNTDAFSMENQIDGKTKSIRNKRLRILSSKKLLSFYRENLNKEFNVLFENEQKNGRIYGYTENYIRVSASFSPGLANTLSPVLITGIGKDGEAECKIFIHNSIEQIN